MINAAVCPPPVPPQNRWPDVLPFTYRSHDCLEQFVNIWWSWDFALVFKVLVLQQFVLRSETRELISEGQNTFCIYILIPRSCQSIKKIGIVLSIKIGKSDLIDINCIDQSAETDDTFVSFINLFLFYRVYRFTRKYMICSLKNENWIHANSKFVANWESKDQTITTF